MDGKTLDERLFICNGEHTRFIAEKLRSTFAVEGGTNKDNRYKCKMLGKFNNACDCVHR